MKNRQVGFLILGLALVIGIIVFLFNTTMTSIVNTSCSHGSECTMYSDIKTQTYISGAIIGIIAIIGIVLIFSKENERIVLRTKTVQAKKKKLSLDGLDKHEKEVIRILEQENGTIFQASLMEKLNIGKVGMTRLLDKLEAKQLIERKRRGMNNVIVLRD